MEYTVNECARLAGISACTLRYYDQIGLLSPARLTAAGYRLYGSREVDRLQQILLYRAMEIPLSQIREMLQDPGFDRERALNGHLATLREKRAQLDTVIQTVEKSLQQLKGECTMKDSEKFEGLRRRAVEENEARYGREIRRRFGDEAMDGANEKSRSLSEKQWEDREALQQCVNDALRRALMTSDPGSPEAMELARLHRKWLCSYWKDDTYTKEAHRALAAMYVQDERFFAYYEGVIPGGAAFLQQAIERYCAE